MAFINTEINLFYTEGELVVRFYSKQTDKFSSISILSVCLSSMYKNVVISDKTSNSFIWNSCSNSVFYGIHQCVDVVNINFQPLLHLQIPNFGQCVSLFAVVLFVPSSRGDIRSDLNLGACRPVKQGGRIVPNSRRVKHIP